MDIGYQYYKYYEALLSKGLGLEVLPKVKNKLCVAMANIGMISVNESYLEEWFPESKEELDTYTKNLYNKNSEEAKELREVQKLTMGAFYTESTLSCKTDIEETDTENILENMNKFKGVIINNLAEEEEPMLEDTEEYEDFILYEDGDDTEVEMDITEAEEIVENEDLFNSIYGDSTENEEEMTIDEVQEVVENQELFDSIYGDSTEDEEEMTIDEVQEVVENQELFDSIYGDSTENEEEMTIEEAEEIVENEDLFNSIYGDDEEDDEEIDIESSYIDEVLEEENTRPNILEHLAKSRLLFDNEALKDEMSELLENNTKKYLDDVDIKMATGIYKVGKTLTKTPNVVKKVIDVGVQKIKCSTKDKDTEN